MSNNGVPVYEAAPEKVQQLADSVMTQIAAIYQQQGIQPNAVQQQMLQSHVGAMASRSVSRCRKWKRSCLKIFRLKR